MKVSKRYLTLDNQLHEGRNIYLSQLILGSLYEYLGLSTKTLKNLKPKDNMLLVGPYWLLQLWLNVMFEPSLDVDKPNDADEDMKNKHVEGLCLDRMALVDTHQTNKEAYLEYFMMFSKRHNFSPSMAPFVNRSHGPEWFTKNFHVIGKQDYKSK